MKILVVHNFYQDPGGEDIVFEQEVKAIKELGHTVEALTFKNKRGLRGLIQFALYPYNFFAAALLRFKIRSFEPEIVHIHNTHYASGPILFRVVEKLGIPVVFTLHNYRLLCPSGTLFYSGKPYLKSIGKNFPWDAVWKGVLDNSILKTFWTAFAYKLHNWLGTWKNINRYITLSQNTKNLILASKLPILAEQILVKGNFIKTFSNRKNQPIKPAYFLFVGRLSEEKGVKQLVDAFKNREDLQLKIIGSGPLEDLTLGYENIENLGYLPRKELLKYYLDCTALIVPSVCFEGFPLTLSGLEAMSLATPLIITDIGAANENIENGKNGFLINPYDFSEKLIEISKRTDLKQIGLNGLETFNKHFTERVIMHKLDEIYAQLLSEA